MNHADHVNLLQGGIAEPGGVWADLGSGSGAFTLALADLLGPEAQIYSVDRNREALRQQAQQMGRRFPAVSIHYLPADYTASLDLPPLDGVVMANSLHFQRDKDPVLHLVRSYLRPGGRLIVVEYDTDRGNRWVPHPVSYRTWEALARRNGFTHTRLLATRPSRFLGQIYSALSLVPAHPPAGLEADSVLNRQVSDST
jgi:ubiquinone/menaquinone biosynthesis C-methylase UbiE